MDINLIPVGLPFERIALDIIGPLPVTALGHKCILIFQDYATKWCEGTVNFNNNFKRHG